MPKLKKGFIIHTAVLVAILLLQITGIMGNLNQMVEAKTPLIEEPPMEFLTAFGGDVFLLPFMAFVIFLELKERKLSRKTFVFVLSAFIGLVMVAILKVIFAEPRPRPLPGANFLSRGAFPSGHAFRAAIIASYVSDRWKRLAPVAWAYAVGVALTRLFLHYHWFGDVLFSLLFAPWLYNLVSSLESLWMPIYLKTLRILHLEVRDFE
ncbi:phosphatase PAP2 family protein [Thermococcus sp.]